MYGWKCRIGLILPSDNTTMESEFNKILRAVDGVSVHATRVFMDTLSVEDLLKMNENVTRASQELRTAEVDIIAYGCTSGSFVKGLNFDRELIERIEKEAKVKATTTSTAVVNALKELNVKKIAVGTPYSDEINERAKEFLEGNGFGVTNTVGLNVVPDVDIGKQEPYVAYNLGRRVNTDDADCIFLSCTDFRTIEIIDALERTLEKPVVTANQATLWHILKLEKLGISIKDRGRLLEKY